MRDLRSAGFSVAATAEKLPPSPGRAHAGLRLTRHARQRGVGVDAAGDFDRRHVPRPHRELGARRRGFGQEHHEAAPVHAFGRRYELGVRTPGPGCRRRRSTRPPPARTRRASTRSRPSTCRTPAAGPARRRASPAPTEAAAVPELQVPMLAVVADDQTPRLTLVLALGEHDPAVARSGRPGDLLARQSVRVARRPSSSPGSARRRPSAMRRTVASSTPAPDTVVTRPDGSRHCTNGSRDSGPDPESPTTA